MQSKKKSFLLHIDSLDILDELSDEQAGMLFKAIAAHQKGMDYELDSIVRIAFSPFKNQFIRDENKYDETCIRRADAGRKGGLAKASNARQKVAKGSKSKQGLAKLADNDNKNKTKNKSDSDKDNKRTVSLSLDYSCWPSMPSEQVLSDWLAMRKRLKANVTQTVINRLSKQLRLASENGISVDDCLSECVVRNWRGFEYEWMSGGNQKVSRLPFADKFKSGSF